MTLTLFWDAQTQLAKRKQTLDDQRVGSMEMSDRRSLEEDTVAIDVRASAVVSLQRPERVVDPEIRIHLSPDRLSAT